jgi:hypothetical protein
MNGRLHDYNQLRKGQGLLPHVVMQLAQQEGTDDLVARRQVVQHPREDVEVFSRPALLKQLPDPVLAFDRTNRDVLLFHVMRGGLATDKATTELAKPVAFHKQGHF